MTPCVAEYLNQSFRMVISNDYRAGIANASLMIQIGQGDGSPMCLDSGGAPKKPLHLWKCAGFRRTHQTWRYDEATKAVVETNMQLCLSVHMSRAVLMPCNKSAPDQQWHATIGGRGGVRSSSGRCLTVMLPPAAGRRNGYIDQVSNCMCVARAYHCLLCAHQINSRANMFTVYDGR